MHSVYFVDTRLQWCVKKKKQILNSISRKCLANKLTLQITLIIICVNPDISSSLLPHKHSESNITGSLCRNLCLEH